MTGPSETHRKLLKEISVLQRRIQELEQSDSGRKGAGEGVLKSEEIFNKAFHLSPILMAISTMEDGRFLDVNAAFLRTLCFSREEVIGKTSLELGLFADPLQRESIKNMTEKNGHAINIEAQIVAKNGQIIEGLFFAEPVTIHNEECWLTVMVDVTERKRVEETLQKSEDRYRQIAEGLSDYLYTVRIRDGQVVETRHSLACSVVTGYTEEDFAANPYLWIDMVVAEDRERILEHIKGILAGKSMHPFEHRIVRKDGKIRWVSDTTILHTDSQGRLESYDGVITDITDLKRAEEEKRILQERLQKADRMEAIGTLAGGIAHDFNNLLTGIQGYASLMLLDLDPSHPHYERLKRIEEEAQNGAELTRELLGFAREGRYEVRPADMNDIIEKSSSIFGRTKKEITIHREYEKELWTVEVDRGQMEQVLMNLYLNAWQAMPGGGEIDLKTENVLLGDEQALSCAVPMGQYVKITVTDTGIGMDEKTRERIFDPFFTTKGMGRGTGLGLATVYGIIKGHQGAIHVYSEPGQGTTFHIYLPASEKKIVRAKRAAGTIDRGTETILLVDDEKMVLEVSKELLESMGYRVYATGSGQEALAVYTEKQKEIDLVILDMIMPGISGGETFDRLRAINPGIKVLLSSGYSLTGAAQKIMDRGCNGFLQKPFRLETLSKKVRETIA